MYNVRYYIFGIVLLIIQLLVGEYVNIWPMLSIAVHPLLFIVAPYNRNVYLNLITGFVIGLLVDFMDGGVIGLNAAAATGVVYFRNPIMKLLFSKVSLENITEINEQSVGTPNFLMLSFISYSIFFILYICLDRWGYFSFWYTLIRFAVNVLANTLVAFVVWKTLIVKLLR